MSTRGAIARVYFDGWRGVYQHSDSYPTYLGQELWHQLWGKYNGAVKEMLIDAIDLHPGGWSSYPEVCYCHDPHFSERDGSSAKDSPYYRKDGPKGTLTSKSCDPLFIEWVYVFAPDRRFLTIFFNTTVKKLVPGQHGQFIQTSRTRHMDGRIEVESSHYYVHRPFQVYSLDGPEPDWKGIDGAVEQLEARDRAMWDPNSQPNPVRRRRW
jgi:hypothetical protein